MSDNELPLDSEEEAPTGEFIWGGIQMFEIDGGSETNEPTNIYATRISGNYFRNVHLEEDDKEDSTVIGDEPEEFELVGVAGLIDHEAPKPFLEKNPYAIYATPDGDRWAAHRLVAEVEDGE